jgi:DNA-binding transcriptional LysR family regulator
MLSVVDDLALLAQVIDAGGFTAASRVTRISKSRLSRRIRELEAHLGLELIHRSSRRFQVTEIGLQLYRHGAAIRAEGDAAVTSVQEVLTEPRGPLRVACPVVLAELAIGQLAAKFAATYPLVQLTFNVFSGLPDPLPEYYDLVIRPSPSGLPSSETIARQLMATPYELVAAPKWVAAAGHPQSAADLTGRDGIGWWQIGDAPHWLLQSADGAPAEIIIRPRFLTNNLMVARTAALAGLGMARLPEPMCARDLAAGRLRRVLADFTPLPMSVYATYSSRRSLSVAGQRFLSDLSAALALDRFRKLVHTRYNT